MNKIDKAIGTCLEMLEQRNYDYFNFINDSDNNNIGVAINSKNDHKIALFILDEGKLTIDQIKFYISETSKYNLDHCIVIFNDTITPVAGKYIHSIPDIHCELFSVAELQSNITKNYLVPKHVKLSSSQSQLFKQQFGIKHAGMNITDPISRFYDFCIGDVIRVERDDYIVYRIVK